MGLTGVDKMVDCVRDPSVGDCLRGFGPWVAGPLAKGVAGVALRGMSAAEVNAAAEASETYYRTMSEAQFAELASTGRLPATSETFISPSRQFSSAYDGTLVRFEVAPGTTDALVGIGVRDASAATDRRTASG